jgi:hypothetical protein
MRAPIAACVVVGLFVAGCERALDPAPTNAILIVSGDAQKTLPRAQVPRLLVVRAVDSAGLPIKGAKVTFSDDAMPFVGATTASTDSNGLAKASWVPGSTVGSFTRTVSSTGLSSATFHATTAEDALEVTVSPNPLVLGGIGDTGSVKLRIKSTSQNLDTIIPAPTWGMDAVWNAEFDGYRPDGGVRWKATKLGSHAWFFFTYGNRNTYFTINVTP